MLRNLNTSNFTDQWISELSEDLVAQTTEYSNTDTQTWTEGGPTTYGIVIFSVIIPITCSFGVIGNSLILVVLSKRCLNESTYTYLSVLAAADLCICILMLFSGLARGVFWEIPGWMELDIFVYLPVGSMMSNLEVMSTVGLAVDRLVLVLSPAKQSKFCTRPVARKIMWVSLLLAIAINIPYFFLYTYNSKGILIYNWKTVPRLINVMSWLQLSVFGLIPAVFLLGANVILIIAVRKTWQQRKLLLARRQCREVKNLRDQSKLTITLISIVFLFLIGEVPTHLASRRSAGTILYGGVVDKINKNAMEIFRTVATLLNAISSSVNVVVYCLANPRFVTILKSLFSRDKIIERVGTLARVLTIKKLRRDCTNIETSGNLMGVEQQQQQPWHF